jgi:hypothetical protein
LNTFWLVCFKKNFNLFYYTKFSQTLYTTNYKLIIEQHDGLIMIENFLTLLSCIYVQKYDCMNDNYFLCLIDHAFTLIQIWYKLVFIVRIRSRIKGPYENHPTLFFPLFFIFQIEKVFLFIFQVGGVREVLQLATYHFP